MNIEKDYLIVGGIVLAMFLFFGLGVWFPENRKIAGYQARIAEAQEQLGPNFNQPMAIQTRQLAVDELRAKIDASDRYIPEDAGLSSVLHSLTEALGNQGVTKQVFEAKEPLSYKHFSKIPIELEFQGGFDTAYEVLRQIETTPRLMRVDGLNLRSNMRRGDASDTAGLRASFWLSSFYTDRQEEGS